MFYIKTSISSFFSKPSIMDFHDFDLNIPFQSNNREFLFDLNQSPAREYNSVNNISTFPVNEGEDYCYSCVYLTLYLCLFTQDVFAFTLRV